MKQGNCVHGACREWELACNLKKKAAIQKHVNKRGEGEGDQQKHPEPQSKRDVRMRGVPVSNWITC